MKLPKNTSISSFFVIFIGDTHGYMNDFKMQKEIIEKANPKYVLYEQMNNKKLIKPLDFTNMLQKKNISVLTETKEVMPLIKLCQKKQLPLIGIDYKNFGIRWANRFKNKLDNNIMFTKEEKKLLNIIHKKREKHQLQEIRKYSKKGKIVVITGAYHLRKRSPLIKGLKHFLAILPYYNGKPAFGPVADKRKLKYGALIK